jgi:hypothetical protein
MFATISRSVGRFKRKNALSNVTVVGLSVNPVMHAPMTRRAYSSNEMWMVGTAVGDAVDVMGF